MKKYQLTENTVVFRGRTLYQIQAVRDIKNPHCRQAKGTLGGFIEGEHNLSHENECWIEPNVYVCDEAEIAGNAYLSGSMNIIISQNANIFDNVEIWGCGGKAEITDNAKMYGNAYIHCSMTRHSPHNVIISGNAEIFDNADIGGSVCISGNSKIYGKAQLNSYHQTVCIVADNAEIFGNASINGAKIVGNAKVFDNAEIELSTVKDNASVFGNAHVWGESLIYDFAEVGGDVCIQNQMEIGGFAQLSAENDVFLAAIVGLHNTTITYFKARDNRIWVSYENDTIEEEDSNVSLIDWLQIYENNRLANPDSVKNFNCILPNCFDICCPLDEFLAYSKQKHPTKIAKEFELLGKVVKSRMLNLE